jgi:hypothetical protein
VRNTADASRRESPTMTDPEEFDLEAPEADAAEQAMRADPTHDEYDEVVPRSGDIEAPEWDALEQSQTVDLEDEYR